MKKFAVAFLLFWAFALSSCAEDDPAASACLIDRDCPGTQVCEATVCAATCEESSDCRPGFFCVPRVNGPGRVCSLSFDGGGDGTNNGFANDGSENDGSANNGSINNGSNFIPEEEEFLVREVATTENFVFVPNSSEDSNTVARIDGRSLSVTPIRVGLRPTEVVAAEVPGVGAVAYVLSEGSATVDVIRADQEAEDGDDGLPVHPLRVPREVNQLALSPDGRHVLAYIDPEKPIEGTSVASLQTLALVRLGDQQGGDEVFELSVSRLIREIEFTDDGSTAYIIGQEGINRIAFDEIDSDTFIPPLSLGLDIDVFPPRDLEMEVSADGTFMVVRSSTFAGLAIFDLTDEALSKRLVSLDGRPTDIDLVSDGTSRRVLATLRDAGQVVIVDVDDALQTPAAETVDREVIVADSLEAGLAQITPGAEQVLLYSTLPLIPSVGVYDFDAETLSTYPLRSQIRGVTVAPDSQTAVIVHQRQTEATGKALNFFQQSWGLTLFDITTGYRRPVVLESQPIDTLLTQTEDGDSLVYVMLRGDADAQGVMRLNLQTYRSDFIQLPRAPTQMGVVAGNVFVSKESDEGRITFFDLRNSAQRTVSGYELNASID